MNKIGTIMRIAPVVPVLVVENVDHAIPIAKALVAGGLRVLEVTLRTDCALDVISAMRSVEGAIVGAGTVLNPDELKQSIDAGAEFIVSPGLTKNLGKAAIEMDVPFLPGTSNAGDIMLGMDLGLKHFKFFPAEASGGRMALKALAAPFRGALFCPTGGISEKTAADWLSIDPVLCVGGSWVVPKGKPDVTAITANAKAAYALKP